MHRERKMNGLRSRPCSGWKGRDAIARQGERVHVIYQGARHGFAVRTHPGYEGGGREAGASRKRGAFSIPICKRPTLRPQLLVAEAAAGGGIDRPAGRHSCELGGKLDQLAATPARVQRTRLEAEASQHGRRAVVAVVRVPDERVERQSVRCFGEPAGRAPAIDVERGEVGAVERAASSTRPSATETGARHPWSTRAPSRARDRRRRSG